MFTKHKCYHIDRGTAVSGHGAVPNWVSGRVLQMACHLEDS